MAAITSGLPSGSGMFPFFRIEVQSTGSHAPVHQTAMVLHTTE